MTLHRHSNSERHFSHLFTPKTSSGHYIYILIQPKITAHYIGCIIIIIAMVVVLIIICPCLIQMTSWIVSQAPSLVLMVTISYTHSPMHFVGKGSSQLRAPSHDANHSPWSHVASLDCCLCCLNKAENFQASWLLLSWLWRVDKALDSRQLQQRWQQLAC